MTLTKADLINQVHSSSSRLTKTQASECVETVLKIMKTTLESGDDVLLTGFGKFNVKAKSARKGRNPKTGEPLMLAARKVITFKASGILREKVNGK